MAKLRVALAAGVMAGILGLNGAGAEIQLKSPTLAGLARAVAAERKCQILIAPERLELERALTSRMTAETQASASEAKQRHDSGLETGSKARCDDTTKGAIKTVLQASRIVPEPTPVASATTAAATAEPKPKPAAKPAVKPAVAAKPQTKPATKPTNSLAAYGSMVEAYYRELRCQTMSASAVRSFYQDVLRAHLRAVQSHGAGAAATAVRRAEARAKSGAC
jgi:outer membrane biosynthesis protein TonB